MQTADVDWNALVAGLSPQAQKRFEVILRRALKRRLGRLAVRGLSQEPEHVRTEAVGAWRKRYMQHASKSARQRMNYDRLRDDPTFVAIERDLLARYNKKHGIAIGPCGEDVGAMTLAEACEAYRNTNPSPSDSPLAGFAHAELAQEYANIADARAVERSMARHVLGVVRTQSLAKLGRVTEADPNHPGALRSRAFTLKDLHTEEEVCARIRSTHLVGNIVLLVWHGRTADVVARDLLVSQVMQSAHVRALRDIVVALLGERRLVLATLRRRAKGDARGIEAYLSGPEFAHRAYHALLENPRYAKEYAWAIELAMRVRENVPETPMDAYPLARTMQRRFVVHVGPTNSGKTHDALEALMSAASGAYLGPLRLLACEQFGYLNRGGCPCSLLTGEEHTEVYGAHHVSSTVEMANFHESLEVAVIDEAQMLSNPDRGHRWTAAILGIPAHEVHVCCAPHALGVVCDLVRLCEDELEVVTHQRFVPLRFETRGFRLPEDVQTGDALVVFSRRSVHAVAEQVRAAGLRPSVVYGALPHDVRLEEARRFDAGETDCVVATDAIGMGMNLPIRRVVFVEQDKFDGHARRTLKDEEVQQIAGRAGRFGRCEEGLVQSTRLRKDLARRFHATVADIRSLAVGIPDDICLVRDASLSDSIRQWMTLEYPEPFYRIDVSRDLALINYVESVLPDDQLTDIDAKQRTMALASMAFDEHDRGLYGVWKQMVAAEVTGTKAELPLPPAPCESSTLASLEADYRMCDLLYNYARTFGRDENKGTLVARREEISHAIMTLLARESEAATSLTRRRS